MTMHPHDITPADVAVQTEQALLGSILMDRSVFAAVGDELRAEDFSEPVHAKIFDVISGMVAEGVEPTIFTLAPYLTTLQLPGYMPAGEYLARLAASASVGAAAAKGYARVLRDLAKRRLLERLCTDAAAAARMPSLDFRPAKLASELVSALDEIASEGLPALLRPTSIGNAGRIALAEAIAAHEGKPARGLSTGLIDLDAVTGGLERGQGSVVAGRPGMGKTALSGDLSLSVAKAGYGVLIFSLEMGAIELANRSLASIAFDDGGRPIAYQRIRRAQLSRDEIRRIDDASRVLDELPIRIDAQPGLTVAQMTARTRRAQKEFEQRGVDLALVVVDHIGLVGPSSRYRGDRVREIGETSAGLHALARECDCHVMMLSQLSRAIESRPDKRPQLHDLRESGEIEQNADLVLSVYREAYYLERSSEPSDAARLPSVEHDLEIGVLKNRQGPTGRAHLFIDITANAVRNQAKPRVPYGD